MMERRRRLMIAGLLAGLAIFSLRQRLEWR